MLREYLADVNDSSCKWLHMTDHECCSWMPSVPFDWEEQCVVLCNGSAHAVSIPAIPLENPVFVLAPTSDTLPPVCLSLDAGNCDWPEGHQPRPLYVCVVCSDIVGGGSADLTAADCSEWEACVGAATKG